MSKVNWFSGIWQLFGILKKNLKFHNQIISYVDYAHQAEKISRQNYLLYIVVVGRCSNEKILARHRDQAKRTHYLLYFYTKTKNAKMQFLHKSTSIKDYFHSGHRSIKLANKLTNPSQKPHQNPSWMFPNQPLNPFLTPLRLLLDPSWAQKKHSQCSVSPTLNYSTIKNQLERSKIRQSTT